MWGLLQGCTPKFVKIAHSRRRLLYTFYIGADVHQCAPSMPPFSYGSDKGVVPPYVPPTPVPLIGVI